mgnify:CR=1 FL=1
MMPIDYAGQLFLTVDPGLRGCGCAIFKDGVLFRAAYVFNSDKEGRGPTSHSHMATEVHRWVGRQLPPLPDMERLHVFVEFPRVYPHSDQQKGDLNDLLDVAGVASAVAAAFFPAQIKHFYPQEWKGTIKKAVMTERIKKSLNSGEQMKVEKAGSKDHNTYDAAGIGLHVLGRLNRKVYS